MIGQIRVRIAAVGAMEATVAVPVEAVAKMDMVEEEEEEEEDGCRDGSLLVAPPLVLAVTMFDQMARAKTPSCYVIAVVVVVEVGHIEAISATLMTALREAVGVVSLLSRINLRSK